MMPTHSKLLLCTTAILLLTTSTAWSQEESRGLSHVVCENCHTVAPAPAHDDCVGCHSRAYGVVVGLRNPPQNVVSEFQRPSHHPLNVSDPNSSCRGCHDTMGIPDPDETVYPRLLRSADAQGVEAYFGNQFCLNCHERGVELPDMELTRFSLSAHDDVRLEPATGTKIRCQACHEPHGAESPALAKAEEEALCYGAADACHSVTGSSFGAVAVRKRFTASADTFAHHNMTSEDQARVAEVVERDPVVSRKWPTVPASKLECSNCHNPHLNNAESPTIDPYDRAAVNDSLTVDPLTIVNKARGKGTTLGTRLTDGAVRGTPVYVDTTVQGENVNVVVDLGSEQTVDKMVAYGGPVEGPNVSSVAYFTSIDGASFSTRGTVSYSGSEARAFTLKFEPTRARYLRFRIYRPYIEPGEEQWDINKYWVSELEAYDTTVGELVADVNRTCLSCHAGTVPSGVTLSEKTRYWRATANSSDRILVGIRRLDWVGEFHGNQDGIGGVINTADTLKPPYRRGMEALACTTCHDEHGSGNVFHLRETVNGTAGIRVTSFRGKDAVGFCKACHNVNLLLGPNHCYGCHTSATGCFDCHYHGKATSAAHGRSGGL